MRHRWINWIMTIYVNCVLVILSFKFFLHTNLKALYSLQLHILLMHLSKFNLIMIFWMSVCNYFVYLYNVNLAINSIMSRNGMWGCTCPRATGKNFAFVHPDPHAIPSLSYFVFFLFHSVYTYIHCTCWMCFYGRINNNNNNKR